MQRRFADAELRTDSPKCARCLQGLIDGLALRMSTDRARPSHLSRNDSTMSRKTLALNRLDAHHARPADTGGPDRSGPLLRYTPFFAGCLFCARDVSVLAPSHCLSRYFPRLSHDRGPHRRGQGLPLTKGYGLLRSMGSLRPKCVGYAWCSGREWESARGEAVAMAVERL